MRSLVSCGEWGAGDQDGDVNVRGVDIDGLPDIRIMGVL